MTWLGCFVMLLTPPAVSLHLHTEEEKRSSFLEILSSSFDFYYFVFLLLLHIQGIFTFIYFSYERWMQISDRFIR